MYIVTALNMLAMKFYNSNLLLEEIIASIVGMQSTTSRMWGKLNGLIQMLIRQKLKVGMNLRS
jgi:hypothetical protein